VRPAFASSRRATTPSSRARATGAGSRATIDHLPTGRFTARTCEIEHRKTKTRSVITVNEVAYDIDVPDVGLRHWPLCASVCVI
jgi:hypothetical protein